MALICIGPICIPWTCIPAIVFFLWRFAKPLLPQDWAIALEKFAAKVRDACAPYLAKVPGFGGSRPATNGKAKEVNGSGGHWVPGEVVHAKSADHLDSLIDKSKKEGFGVVLDFTAPWCKPCQAIKPRFKALAAEHASHCFVEVDTDELSGVMASHGVLALPTFQVYLKGKQVGSATGGDEKKLVQLLASHLPASTGVRQRAC